MLNPFVSFYHFVSGRKRIFFLLLLGFIGLTAFLASGLKLDEDIRGIIPQDVRINSINRVLKNSSFADRIILTLSLKNKETEDSGKLVSSAAPLVDSLQSYTSHIKNVQFKIRLEDYQEIYQFFYDHLPLYLEEQDYQDLEQKIQPDELKKVFQKAFRTLISPSGVALKRFIFKDPLSITPTALKKLDQFRLDRNFILHESAIFTRDKKNLLIFIDPVFPSSKTAENKALIQFLDQMKVDFAKQSPDIELDYYGGTAVAVANANQIKSDIILTVSAAMAFLFLFFLMFFRSLKVFFSLFIPVALGALFSLAMLSLIEGQISAIALGIGAVLLGISIDYSLHLFTHFRENQSVQLSLKDVTEPVLMSSLTTASAFLCLFIVRSEALNELGMFAAFAVTGSAFFVLTLLPFLLKSKKGSAATAVRSTFLDKIAGYAWEKNKWVLLAVVGFSILFVFTAGKIEFNSDISSLNYMPESLKRAEDKLKSISSETMTAVYLVHSGDTLDKALVRAEKDLEKLKAFPGKYSAASAAQLMMSQEKQQQKIERWNRFIDKIDADQLIERMKTTGREFHFKPEAFQAFYQLLKKDFQPVLPEAFNILQESFLKNYLNSSDKEKSVTTIIRVDQGDKEDLFQNIAQEEHSVLFDRQYYTNQFFEILSEDFDKLVWLSMGIVFITLLIFYGRIELALVAFIPILLSWLWVVGLMGLFGIKFNIFNIIISTFIFGIGIDHCIFVMKGLLNHYKYGNRPLTPYKLSILLSSITTIMGVGVLIFGEHPALKSIALVSIFGILSIILIVYTVLPRLFLFLVRSKGNRRVEPVRIVNALVSLSTLLTFVVGTLSMVFLIPFLYLLPIPRRTVKYLFHWLIMATCRFIIYMNVTIKKDYLHTERLDFSRPSVIVANHQSYLDLVTLLMLHPKMIALTNEWVWKNPFIGFIVRFADYFPVYQGMDEQGLEKIRKKVGQGYSVLIFPEGTRSTDGSIKRFHQGAFKIADELNLDIQPILIHGNYDLAPKREFILRPGHANFLVLNRYKPRTPDFEKGETYNILAKECVRMMRTELEKSRIIRETPDYFVNRLIAQYIYKGPVLEWYVKIKLKLEKNFKYFHEIIPTKGQITDIGCGYGYLGYMLKLVAPERKVLGIDYDQEKIDVASEIAVEDPDLNFVVGDATEVELPESDVFIITDVLHYLPENLQERLITKCMEKLLPDGKLIIRDADADLEERTKVTKQTELHSTKLFRFNKTQYDLTFVSGKQIERIAEQQGFDFERVDNTVYTANITYVLTRK